MKQLNLEAFHGLQIELSCRIINESSPYLGWYERILCCSEVNDTYLIEYVFRGKTWLSFRVSGSNDTVYYAHAEFIPPETVENISKGVVLKLWLQLNKKYCLHASGIRTGDSVILFMGPKGAGKSTAAAYFNTNGYPVWCDDYCVLEHTNGAFYAHAGESHLRIKNETVQGLSIAAEHMDPLYFPVPGIESKTTPVGTFKARYRNAGQPERDRHSLPLKAIFLLQERKVNTRATVEPARKTEALKLIMNEIMLQGIVSKEYIASYFSETKKLVDHAKIYKVQAEDDLARIHVFFESIMTLATDADN